MTIHYRQQGSAIIVLGNTYPYRDELKALGARFNGSEKNWRIPHSAANVSAVAALCTSSGGSELPPLHRSPDIGTPVVPYGDGPIPGPAGSSPADFGLPLPAPRSPRLPDGLLPPLAAELHQELRQNLRAGVPLELAVPSATADLYAAFEQAMAPGQRSKSDAPSLSIRQLMERAEQSINAAFPASVWVVGEVQNLAVKASGIFFDLAEGRASGHANATVTVRAIMWKATLGIIRARRGADILKDILQDGMQLRCLCQVQLYKDRGSLSLLISDIDPSFSKGALALAREKLLAELRRSGLATAQKQLQLPPFPLRLGLISAEGSRAVSDFLDQLSSLAYPGTVVFCPAVMQGEDVPRQVVQALRQLEAASCDLIVITRGGGSAADLRWFDAAEIAHAIARSPLPIIAAIGHHEDVCVAEEICYLRQKTPTAAADFVVGTCQATRALIDSHAALLAKLLTRRVEEFTWQTAALSERLGAAGQRAVSLREAAATQQAVQLQRQATVRLHGQTQAVALTCSQLSRAAERSVGGAAAALTAVSAQLGSAVDRPLNSVKFSLQTAQAQINRAGERALQDPGRRLRQAESLLAAAAKTSVSTARLSLQAAKAQLQLAVHAALHRASQRLPPAQTQLALASERAVSTAAAQLQGLAASLARRDPGAWLAEGWTQLSANGRRLSSLAQVEPGDSLKARLRDGVLRLQVTGKEPRQGHPTAPESPPLSGSEAAADPATNNAQPSAAALTKTEIPT